MDYGNENIIIIWNFQIFVEFFDKFFWANRVNILI